MPYDSGMGSMSSLNSRVASLLKGQPLDVKAITSGIGNTISPTGLNQLIASIKPPTAPITFMDAGRVAGSPAYTGFNSVGGIGSVPYGPPMPNTHPAANINANGGVGSVPYGPPTGVGPATDPGPMTFEQALATAQKMLRESGAGSGSAMAPINAAIKAAQNSAANSSKQTKANTTRTKSDLAVLYGRLGNYIKGMLSGEQAANTGAQNQVGASFDHLASTDAANAQAGQQGVASELARLGLGSQAENANANTAADAAHIASMIAANKTSTLGNMKANATGAENVLRDLRAGAASYGTGLVGKAGVQGQQALADIATALQNQLGTLNAQKATARASGSSNALDLAMKILSGQPTAPSALQQAETDKTTAQTQQILAALAGGTPATNYKGAANQGFNAASNYIAQNASSQQSATVMKNLLNLVETGGASNKHLHYQFSLNDPKMMQALAGSAKDHKLSAADTAALNNAVLIALKQY